MAVVYKHTRLDTNKILDQNPNCKIVLDIETGVFYSSLKEVSILYNIRYGNLVKKLCGQNKNNTNFRYV